MSHSILRRHRTSLHGHHETEHDPSRQSCETRHALGEQDRRKPLASFDGRFIGRPPCAEKLHVLLSCAVVVPFAIALHVCDQSFERVMVAGSTRVSKSLLQPYMSHEQI